MPRTKLLRANVVRMLTVLIHGDWRITNCPRRFLLMNHALRDRSRLCDLPLHGNGRTFTCG